LNPVKCWRLNERHYGNLEGLDKKETVEKYGKEQVLIWRRSYDIPPGMADESYVNEINKDINAYTNDGKDFCSNLQSALRQKYKDFSLISQQLDYLKSKDLFDDLSAEQYQSFKQALNDLFNQKDLSSEQEALVNRECEYLQVRGESLKMTLARVKKWLRLEYLLWDSDERVLIVAHGNSLRAMIKMLECISDKDITSLNIPTGSPILYSLSGLEVTKKEFAEDEEAVKKRAEAVANQTK
jgi:bisphosphoglycerate-dependent phosphoglycerate mutase